MWMCLCAWPKEKKSKSGQTPWPWADCQPWRALASLESNMAPLTHSKTSNDSGTSQTRSKQTCVNIPSILAGMIQKCETLIHVWLRCTQSETFVKSRPRAPWPALASLGQPWRVLALNANAFPPPFPHSETSSDSRSRQIQALLFSSVRSLELRASANGELTTRGLGLTCSTAQRVGELKSVCRKWHVWSQN